MFNYVGILEQNIYSPNETTSSIINKKIVSFECLNKLILYVLIMAVHL